MYVTFEKFQRQLAHVTFGALITGLAFFVLAIVSALLGFSQAVASFRGVAASIAYVFGALLVLFLLTALVGAAIRWVDRRSQLRSRSN